MKKRDAKGKATFGQLEALAKMGVDAGRALSFEAARALIGEMDKRAKLVAKPKMKGFHDYAGSFDHDFDY